MTISVNFEQGNASPRIVRITTTSTLAQVTTAGWYNNSAPNKLQPSDEVEIAYLNGLSGAATAFFSVSITAGVVTLSLAESSVVLPVVSGNFANFSGTSGALADLGYLPSDATKTRVVMAGSAVQIGYLAHYIDVTGTIDDTAGAVINNGTIQSGISGNAGGFIAYPPTAANGFLELLAINAGGAFNTIVSNSAMLQSSTISIPDPGASTAGFILTSKAGGSQSISGAVVVAGAITSTAGPITSGSSGDAGSFISFPATAANGTFIFEALNAGGAFNTTIRNSVMAQSTVYSLGDIGAATGGIPVATAPFLMKQVAGAAAAGGAAAQSFTDAFCTTGSNVIGNWNTQANAASVLKIVPGNGSFVVTSSADAGVGTFNYVIMK